MSANRTVTCLRSPSSAPRDARIFRARCGGVYDEGERRARRIAHPRGRRRRRMAPAFGAEAASRPIAVAAARAPQRETSCRRPRRTWHRLDCLRRRRRSAWSVPLDRSVAIPRRSIRPRAGPACRKECCAAHRISIYSRSFNADLPHCYAHRHASFHAPNARPPGRMGGDLALCPFCSRGARPSTSALGRRRPIECRSPSRRNRATRRRTTIRTPSSPSDLRSAVFG